MRNYFERVRNELFAGKVETMIPLKSKTRKVRNYLIEPFLKVAGYDDSVVQIFVRLTNLQSQEVGTRMIIEAWPFQAISLISSFTIKGKLVEAKPSTTKYGYSFSEQYR
ncbi:MAG: hypothetical protein KIT34_12695 [Cyanobacteria bacterium TGS_CYA1]|nr:hypothetical protein [Cyanobacteria bacterium TGS_CYA1]